jgi:hypothetical protein
MILWAAGYLFTSGLTGEDGWNMLLFWPYELGKHLR